MKSYDPDVGLHPGCKSGLEGDPDPQMECWSLNGCPGPGMGFCIPFHKYVVIYLTSPLLVDF